MTKSAIWLYMLFFAFFANSIADAQDREKKETETKPQTSKTKKKSAKPDASQAMDQLFARWNKPDSPGVAVAVVQDGKTIFKKGYGTANLEYAVPVTPKTVFHIASVSKQFTTFAVLLLADQKKLSLDDDVRKHIPELHDFGSKITLRHLAHHTSGLRDQWSLLVAAGWRMDDVITRNQIMKLLQNQRELNFQPGEKHTYCNSGYTLLAEVVARVSGKSFAEFTKANIFEPLGMKDTLFYDDHEKIVPNRAYSYKRQRGRLKKSVLSYANVGATSLFTTAEDLAKWANNFEKPKVGNQKILDKMKTKGVLNDGKEIDYALGQVVGTYRGLKTISHGGGDAGYRTYLSRFPDQKFSVVLLSNDASFNPGFVNNKVVDIFLADKLEENKPAPKGKKIDSKILKQYVANYELRPGFNLAITQKDGVLYAQATGQSKLKFDAISGTNFVFKPAGVELTFQMDEAKKEPVMTFKQRGVVLKIRPSTKFDPSALKLSDYEGVFHSPELSTEYELVVEKEKLLLKHSRHNDATVIVTAKDKLIAPNLGRIEFIRDKNKKITGFKASTGRVLNLKFDKN